MELGKTLAKLRKEEGINQKEFAEAMGVSYGAVGMWETDKRQPDLDMLKKIAMYFNVSTDYLLGLPDKNLISASENTLLNLYRQCDDYSQQYLIAKARVLVVEGVSTPESDRYADTEKKIISSDWFRRQRQRLKKIA